MFVTSPETSICRSALSAKGWEAVRTWVPAGSRREKSPDSLVSAATSPARTVAPLSGRPVTEADFGPEKVLRLWEYGPGDMVRQSTCASVERVAPDVLQLDADVEVTLGLKAAIVEISTDRQGWKPLAARREGQWYMVAIPAQAGSVYLRLGR